MIEIAASISALVVNGKVAATQVACQFANRCDAVRRTVEI